MYVCMHACVCVWMDGETYIHNAYVIHTYIQLTELFRDDRRNCLNTVNVDADEMLE
jgi:hypothetical protein